MSDCRKISRKYRTYIKFHSILKNFTELCSVGVNIFSYSSCPGFDSPSRHRLSSIVYDFLSKVI
jgi:hypothetical protein